MLYKSLLQQWGTISMNQISVEMGDAPIQNWHGSNQSFPFKKSDSTSPDQITRFEKKKYHCRSCALGCGGIVSNEVVPEGHKPEYETVLAWGGLLMQGRPGAYLFDQRKTKPGRHGFNLCWRNGGICDRVRSNMGCLPQEDLDGLDLRWDNPSAILALARLDDPP